jgi:hypothetical protein
MTCLELTQALKLLRSEAGNRHRVGNPRRSTKLCGFQGSADMRGLTPMLQTLTQKIGFVYSLNCSFLH